LFTRDIELENLPYSLGIAGPEVKLLNFHFGLLENLFGSRPE
jgi:hypothetical protein